LIHFDFDDRYQDEHVVGSAISRREGFLMSVVAHALILVVIAFIPRLALFQPSPEELRRRQLLELDRPEDQRFVFVQPRNDILAPRPPERAELSDADRRAQSPEPSPLPNPLPRSLGNSPERVEAEEAERARGLEEQPEPPQPEPESQVASALPPAETAVQPRPAAPRSPPGRGALGEALRNLQQYMQNESFDNPQGGTDDPGATIQFDTKGVEFGPWLRRFVAQVRRNWFIPLAAYTMRGRVVLQFNIHKDGSITDIAVVRPAEIEAFNQAAYGAIYQSNPTAPLPPEYPADKAFFTVTFYYNEPPGP
jgi:TonB family protein